MPELILSANGETPTPQSHAPQPAYHVSPEGLAITIPTGPNTVMQHLIPMPVMREILHKVREVERVNADMARIAQDALRTKR